MDEVVCVSSSPEATGAIGSALAAELRAGDVVTLAGDLGAGKTRLVQGAAEALGVRARVQSPSFVLVREYRGSVRVVHADVYRLGSLQELIDLGYEDVLDPDSIAFIEWGDAVSGVLPSDRIEVSISIEPDDRRRIVVRATGAASERLDTIAKRLDEWRGMVP